MDFPLQIQEIRVKRIRVNQVLGVYQCLGFFKSTAVQRSSFDFSNNVVYNVAVTKTAQRIKVAQ